MPGILQIPNKCVLTIASRTKKSPDYLKMSAEHACNRQRIVKDTGELQSLTWQACHSVPAVSGKCLSVQLPAPDVKLALNWRGSHGCSLSPGVLRAGLTSRTGSTCKLVSIPDTCRGSAKLWCCNSLDLNMTGGRHTHHTSRTGKHGLTHLKYAGTTNRDSWTHVKRGFKTAVPNDGAKCYASDRINPHLGSPRSVTYTRSTMQNAGSSFKYRLRGGRKMITQCNSPLRPPVTQWVTVLSLCVNCSSKRLLLALLCNTREEIKIPILQAWNLPHNIKPNGEGR